VSQRLNEQCPHFYVYGSKQSMCDVSNYCDDSLGLFWETTSR
jgi:hypothetical protein